jgi:uncharacterized protein
VRILMAGASGFLGTKLARRLRESDHQVVRLVRRAASGADEVRWDPATGGLDPATVSGVDAVINLSGANIGAKRWTAKYKQTLLDSRLGPTRTLVTAMAALPPEERPGVLLNQSGVHAYGDNGDRQVDERTDAAGRGFLSEMVRHWEATAAPASDVGIRVVLMRTGLPLAPGGGLLGPLMLPFRLGVGGPLAGGRSYVPWISMPDWLSAVEFLLANPGISGPVNVCGPAPVRNSELSRALGRRLRRPAVFPVPRLALTVVGGSEFADEALASLRVLPLVLTDRGFHFDHGTVDEALAAAIPR